MKKYNFVYKTTCLVNNKIYVGRHSTNNLDDGYLGSGKALLLSVKKYGKKNFNREILEFCNEIQELNKREEFWIFELNSLNRSIGYNLSEFSSGGDLLTNNENLEEIKKKISKAVRSSNRWSLENRLKQSKEMKLNNPMKEEKAKDCFRGDRNPMKKEENKSKIFTEEYSKKMSLILKERYSHCTKDELIKRFGGNKGKKMKPITEETREKMSLAHKGHIVSEDHRRKIGLANKGKIVSEETKEKMSLAGKGLRKSEETKKRLALAKSKTYYVKFSKDDILIKIYENTLELKEEGFTRQNMLDKDKYPLRTHKGYKWKKFKKDETSKEEIFQLYRESI